MIRDGRRLIFEGIKNCRDLGSLETADGKKIREGLLLRSEILTYATLKDTQELAEEFHLSEILDLRNDWEISEKPDQPVPGARHVGMPILEFQQAGITHEEEQEELPAYERFPGMGDLYIKFFTEYPLNRNMARAVHRVLTHDYDSGAVLWHCFGGKDRCGMVAAMTLSLLGVPYETIKEDYMMTNIVMEPRANAAYAEVLARGGPQKEADFVYDANIAKEQYIDDAFAALREHYGDVETFLKEMDGVTDDEIAAFKARVTEAL